MQNYVDPSRLGINGFVRDPASGARPIDFDQILAAARRQVRVVVLLAGMGLLVGAVYAVTVEPEYTATADLIIDSQKDKNQVSASIAELTFDTSAIDSQVEVLKSEKIALAVIAALHLDSDPEFTRGKGSVFGEGLVALRRVFEVGRWFVSRQDMDAEAKPDMDRAAIARLKGNLDVRRIARTYVLAISYTSTDRAKAAVIANAFADAYINEQLDSKFEATRRAAAWLQNRLTELKQQSIDSDLAIQRFKAAHGIVVTGGDKPGLISDQQLSELNEQIIGARADTAKAEARYQQIQDLLRSGRIGAAVPDSLSNPVINDLRSKYLAASKSESQLEAKLGSSHIQVVELKREMAEYNRLIYEELQRISESYRSDAEVARQKEQSLARSMSSLVGQSEITNETLVQLRQLQRESETYRSLYQTFMQRYQETLQQQSFPISEARVITGATSPQVPSYPRRGLVSALGLLFGVLFGAGVGVVRERRDRVFRSASQVRDELGLELLGLLQKVDGRGSTRSVEERDPRRLHFTGVVERYTIDHPLSGFSETLRSAKVAVDLAVGERKPKVVGIISVLPNEGKSTVAKNFSSLLAHLGVRTLLIDADLRNPGLTRSVARHAETGLLEALKHEKPLADYLLAEPESGLVFLPAVVKKRVLHSSEVLSSPAMRDLLIKAGENFDYIVLDLPPLGPVVDVRAASSLFDAFIFVAEWGRTPRAIVKNLLGSDQALYEKCVGVLFNKVNFSRINLYESYGSRDYYYGKYGKYYHKERA